MGGYFSVFSLTVDQTKQNLFRRENEKGIISGLEQLAYLFWKTNASAETHYASIQDKYGDA